MLPQGVPMAQAALRWCLMEEAVSVVIPGAKNADQARANAAAGRLPPIDPGAMEEVLAGHPDVAECAVVGIKDSLKGQVPLGLVVLKSGVAKGEAAICKELVGLVRDRIGPVAAFKDAKVVTRLPKTRSGKILRATLRKIADGEDYIVPPTIDDASILGDLEGALRGIVC